MFAPSSPLSCFLPPISFRIRFTIKPGCPFANLVLGGNYWDLILSKVLVSVFVCFAFICIMGRSCLHFYVFPCTYQDSVLPFYALFYAFMCIVRSMFLHLSVCNSEGRVLHRISARIFCFFMPRGGFWDHGSDFSASGSDFSALGLTFRPGDNFG